MTEFAYESGDDPKKKEDLSGVKVSTGKKILLVVLGAGFLASIALLGLYYGKFILVNDDDDESPESARLKRQIYHPAIAEMYNAEDLRSSRRLDSCDGVCNSSTCLEQADLFARNMDPEIDPCDDFYNYACGNFIKTVPIPSDDTKIDPLRIIERRINTELIAALYQKPDPAEPTAFQKTRKFFQACTAESLIQTHGVSIFMETLNNAGGWPVLRSEAWNEQSFDWVRTVLKLYEMGWPVFFPGSVSIAGPNRNILLQPPKLVIDKTFLKDAQSNKRLKAYFSYMVDIATMMGVSKYNAFNELKDSLEFEINLFKIISTTEEIMKSPNQYNNVYSIKELSQKYPSVPWLEFFQKIFEHTTKSIDEDEIVYLPDPYYIPKLEELLARTPKRVLANFLLWNVVQKGIDYLPDAYLDRRGAYEKLMAGADQRQAREFLCLSDVKKIFKVSSSAMYARIYFNAGFKQGTLDILEGIKNQFKEQLLETEWMDEEARILAVDKLDAMEVFVAYTDEFFDDAKIDEYYEDLEIDTEHYLLASMNITRFWISRTYNESMLPAADYKDWTSHIHTASVSATYQILSNSIEIPAGILQREYFNKYRPNYLNYGAIGSVIGHEMTHGFDNLGHLYNKKGIRENFWKPSTNKLFHQKEQCFVDQYGNYTVEQVGRKIKGRLTLGENIADNGGYKLAYRAYNQWTRKNGIEMCLPKLDLTPRQLFWVGAANIWCRVQKSEELKKKLDLNSHSPAIARVNIPFSNIHEFSRDFNCKRGSAMNPIHKCAVW